MINIRISLKEAIYLFTGWLTLFIIGTDLFVISPLLPSIAQEYEITPAVAGWLVTVFSLMYAMSAPLFGWLSDRKGRRLLIVCGLLSFGIANFLTAISQSLAMLITSRIFAGLSVASITPLVYAIIGDTALPERRGVWLSIVVSGHLTALWAGAPIGTLLGQFLGWRSVFISLTIIAALLSILNVRAWASINKAHPLEAQTKGSAIKIISAVSVTAFWAIAMYALYVFLGTGLVLENHFSPSELAASITAYGIGAVVGSLSSGRVTDKIGAKKVSIFSTAMLIGILALLGFFFTSGTLVYFLLFLWALIGYASFTSYQARLAEEFPETRGMALALNNTALYIGITLGSMMGGFIITKWGFFTLPFICSGAALISCLISAKRKI
ncbi:MFS transporter [Desulfitobacterium chlororespirans]|uniref:Predicted arabinose efflux permease, MFS family n=1 Tax=Desulfitobacterium chlororespirans DSM 11544 TaxID=1121395 RepID=A0A1M7SNA6_9FIRM|nr:MFS transporter [Desulfitobacterium chlororespirans]SHN59959.1 Predicted arabinose efflux permease, MFS family [Desulfitobacterium chlororespirans DSM 11544]